MTYEEMKAYVDKSLEAYPDTISTFDLTGGECMLLGKDIDKIFSYATGKGLTCGMISNAFWASDYDKAFKTLKRLKRSGLRSISFSTGTDHNRYVPWMNVRHASVAATRLGLVTQLRIEGYGAVNEITDGLNADAEVVAFTNQGRLKIVRSPWMEYHNKGKKNRNWRTPFYDHGEHQACSSLFQNIVINPYGEVYACCGIGVCHIPQMRLGNIHQEPIKTIYERAFEDFLKIWLFTDGPERILKYVHGKTGQKFPWHTGHICDICRVIFTDKSIIPLIRDNFYDVADIPLSMYECKAEINNEDRRGRKKASQPKADSQQIQEG